MVLSNLKGVSIVMYTNINKEELDVICKCAENYPPGCGRSYFHDRGSSEHCLFSDHADESLKNGNSRIEDG